MKQKLFWFIAFSIQAYFINAQTFYFQNKETTLIKTTDQSPAHWYIEIFSNGEEDIMLRWKAFFTSIPTEWNISFNDQTEMHSNVQDGDSSDFELFSNPEITQKLVIGAQLNNVVGNGTVSFEIYNPEVLEEKDTIHFHFTISQGSLNLENTVLEQFFYLNAEKITSLSGEVAFFKVFDESGREVYNYSASEFDLSSLPQNQLFFIQIKQDNQLFYLKLIR